MSEDRVSLRFESFRRFLDECADQISEEGIFLATEPIRPIGTKVEFDIGLDDDFPILRGSGEVVWVVEPNGGSGAPGMAVRYDSTDAATTTLVQKIAERQRTRTGAAFDLSHEGVGETEADSDEAVEIEEPIFATQAIEAPILDELDSELDRTPGDQLEVAPEALTVPETPVMPPYLEEAGVASTKRGRGKLWATLALVAVVSGTAYWQRDFLVEKLSGGGSPPEAERSVEPVDLPGVDPITTEAEEPVVATASEPEEVEPALEQETPTAPLTRVEEVRWRATDQGTLLQLVADGAFPEAEGDGFAIERLEDPPRLLLRIPGVATPLAQPTVAVGTEEVVGVRTAVHGSPPSSALHVVVDLADPTAQITSSRTQGTLLQLRISSAAISP